MKKAILLLSLSSLLGVFYSCSNDDTQLEESVSSEMPLKSYTLSKDANGSYTLDYNVADGIDTEISKSSGVNNVLLNKGTNTTNNNSTKLNLENDQLTVDFITENGVDIPSIGLLDTPLTSTANKGTTMGKSPNDLTSYQISLLENGEYLLEFTLSDNSVPSFEFNEAENRHEVVIREGDNKGVNSYSKKYTKLEDVQLRIIFVYMHTYNSKTTDGPGGGSTWGPPYFTSPS